MYYGDWLENMRHGQGIMHYATPRKDETQYVRYVGSWEKDKKHGDGKTYKLDLKEIEPDNKRTW